MIEAVILGIADHLGWAILVAASADGEVVDRRRVELVEPDLTAAPIHYEGKGRAPAEVAALVEEVRSSVARSARAVFDELAADLPAPVEGIALRSLPAAFPTDIEALLRSPWEARADAVMYREVLVEVVEERGWRVHFYEAKQVLDRALELLGERADEVLQGPRRQLGPPWAKDHRVALAAAIVAGSSD